MCSSYLLLHNQPHQNLVAYNNCMTLTDCMSMESKKDSEGKVLLSSVIAGPLVWMALMGRRVWNSWGENSGTRSILPGGFFNHMSGAWAGMMEGQTSWNCRQQGQTSRGSWQFWMKAEGFFLLWFTHIFSWFCHERGFFIVHRWGKNNLINIFLPSPLVKKCFNF